MVEIWADIKGYEGLYQVSNYGRVKSLIKHNGTSERILKSYDNRRGYLYVTLCKDSKMKHKSIHRLVLQAFNPVENMENLDVNHLDEDKTNNELSNLEWCTREYNNSYGTRLERFAKSKSIPVVQLTLEGELVRIWDSAIEAERELGFYNSAITRCCKHRYTKNRPNIYKGYIWCYLSDYNDI